MPNNIITGCLVFLFFIFYPLQIAAQSNIIWSSNFESGNIATEWQRSAVQGGGGDIIFQNSSIQPTILSSPVHGGTKATGLTIDLGPTGSTSNQAVYLFRWFITPPVSPYYYSAWYYIPSTISPEYYHQSGNSWWSIFQFKSTTNNRANNQPMFFVDVLRKNSSTNDLMLVLTFRPNMETVKQEYKQATPLTVPRDKWFHLEGYYVPSETNGQVTIWQDGVQIFNVTDKPTILSDKTVFWSVHHYAPAQSQFTPRISTIYVDDAVISTTRVGIGCSDSPDLDCDRRITSLDLVKIIMQLGQSTTTGIADLIEGTRMYGRDF